MAVTTSATGSAVPRDWLAVDQSAAARGFGPAAYGDPKVSPPAPVVPSPASPLGAALAPVPDDAREVIYDGDGSGAWPALAAGWYGTIPLDRGEGFPQGILAAQIPNGDQLGVWNTTEPLQTYDMLSQHVNGEGWIENVPNDRVSARLTFGQANELNNPTWYPYSENPAHVRLARTGQGYTADPYQHGSPGFSNGALPDWAMSGGQGNTAYETPPPPPAGQNAAAFSADPAGGWA